MKREHAAQGLLAPNFPDLDQFWQKIKFQQDAPVRRWNKCVSASVDEWFGAHSCHLPRGRTSLRISTVTIFYGTWLLVALFSCRTYLSIVL